MFRNAQNENKRSYWIGDRVWNDLLLHWNAPGYHSKCAQAKKNWAFEKGWCKHIGGSISFAGSRHSLGMYIKIIIHTSLYLFNLLLNICFIMFVNS